MKMEDGVPLTTVPPVQVTTPAAGPAQENPPEAVTGPTNAKFVGRVSVTLTPVAVPVPE